MVSEQWKTETLQQIDNLNTYRELSRIALNALEFRMHTLSADEDDASLQEIIDAAIARADKLKPRENLPCQEVLQ